MSPDLDACGCCETTLPEPSTWNRPGLPAILFRIGTHPTFLRRMLAGLRLRGNGFSLAALTTRAEDDPSIALLDAWATVGDVLTFYQERIANEGYLHTATERRSVLELARTIGYELRPGVAASTYLTFDVEDRGGAVGATAVARKDQALPGLQPPNAVNVPRGTKVQSVPGQDELPQTFETSNDVVARPEWNRLRPRLTRPQLIASDGTMIFLADETGNPAGGTKVALEQIYLEGTATTLRAGDYLVFATDAKTNPTPLVRVVSRIAMDEENDRTRIDLAAAPKPLPAFKLPAKPAAQITLSKLALKGSVLDAAVRNATWNEKDLSAFMSLQRWRAKDVAAYIAKPQPVAPSAMGLVEAYAFAVKTACFGNTAPRYGTLPVSTNLKSDPYTREWDPTAAVPNPPATTIWMDSKGNQYDSTDPVTYLEREVPQATPETWAIFESASAGSFVYRIDASSDEFRADFALTGRATRLKLTAVGATAKPNGLTFRETVAHVGSSRLALAELPIGDAIDAGTNTLVLDGLVLGLQAGQPLALNGERSDLAGVAADEVATIKTVKHVGGYTTLEFERGLEHGYVRNTLTLSANVVAATHGETVPREVLGGGNGSAPTQRFVLKRPPLTYVSAPTASGSESTLAVRIDDVLWQEVPSLYGHDPHDQVYTVRLDDDGKTAVIFGDGKQGARPPTGAENVRATYRTGIGTPGEVAADKLTMMQTRPLGLRGVTNPLAASGAANPESRDDARANAPLTVLTLERIVSLRDFEDFSGAFAGIGKAQAIALWAGETQIVHVTAATATGDPLDPASATYRNLVSAIAGATDRSQAVRVDGYDGLYFNVTASVAIDARYESGKVLAAVESALKRHFAFERRGFGQPVTAADVVTTVQAVPGVVFVDLDELYLFHQGPSAAPPSLEDVLDAKRARWPDERNRPGEHTLADQVLPAQLLLLNPVGIDISERSA
jgi:hypothetical protein